MSVCGCVHLLVQIHKKFKNARFVHKNKNKKCTREIKLRIATAKARFNNKEKCFMFSNQDLNLSNKLQNATFGAQFIVVLKIAQFEK